MSRKASRLGKLSRRNCLKGTGAAALTALFGVGMSGAATAAPECDAIEATVTFNDQPVEDEELVVESTYMADGGFVTIHDTRLLDGVGAGSIIGVSEHLGSGEHEDVPVQLFEEPLETEKETLDENQRLIAVPHLDTNDNEEFDFLPSDPNPDVAYTEGPQAVGGLPNDGVNDVAWVTVS